jgi:hypothetical protein
MRKRVIETIAWVFVLLLVTYCLIPEQHKEIKYTEVPVQEYSYYFEEGRIVITEISKNERIYDLKYNPSSCTGTLLSNIPGIYISTILKSKGYITKSKAVEWNEIDSIIVETLTKGCEDEESINEYFDHSDSFIIDDSMFKNNI